MRITYKGDYALKAVLDLAIHYESGEVVTIQNMAKRIDAPVKFLEQILLDLKKFGIIESRRGKVGGYYLSKAPDKITVGEIVRFIDGKVEPIACVGEKYVECGDLYKCTFRKIWQSVYEATSRIVDGVTFGDLAAQVVEQEKAFDYSI